MNNILRWCAGIAITLASSLVGAANLDLPDRSPEERIGFALYTVHGGVLKMTAQFYPLLDDEPREATLEIRRDDAWQEVAAAPINPEGWTALFRVENWPQEHEARYRVSHNDMAFLEGRIRANPAYQDTVSVAMFTGNSIAPAHGGDISRDDLVRNVQALDPDLLFFSGDQVYHHRRHYDAWMKFGRDFKKILCNYPTVSIPDDHDVGQSNLWGAGGKKSAVEAGHDGGYFAPAEYVKEVERAQTAHLPDPYDPTPIEQGIGVYYTSLTIGGVSFAIIEDRKFKTGPEGLVPEMGPRPDHITTPDYDPKALDVAGAELLGKRQLDFLAHWAQDWDGAHMKAVLSQTVFAGGAHLHGKHDNRLYADLDSNGWPQTGRNKALGEIRKAFGVMLSGDQHLGSVIHHGIEEWRDAGYSFCVPSIANLYLRWWAPLEEGRNRPEGAPAHLGDFHDGFGNPVTMVAVANPDPEPNGGQELTTRAAGFGLATFDNAARTVTFNCWPRNVDVQDPDTRQYPGWPVTVPQLANHGTKALGHLPAVAAEGDTLPVVRVIQESNGELVYSLRIPADGFAPPVYAPGAYTLEIHRDKGLETHRGLTVTAPVD